MIPMARRQVARSAKTGRFVKATTVKRHPRTTVVDQVGGPKKGKPVKVARSAISGRFVKEATAERHPETTVVETVRR